MLEWVHKRLTPAAQKLPAAPPTGRIALVKENWEMITQDPWVLLNSMGHELELLSNPVQTKVPHVPNT